MIEYYDKVLILTFEDRLITLEDWQRKYGLTVGSPEIGKYFKFTEGKFLQDLKRYGKLIVCEPLIMVMDEYRRLKGKPVTVNAFNRDHQHQMELKAKGFRTAEFSPHEEKMAGDLDTLDKADTLVSKDIMLQAGQNLNIKIRVGFQQYLDMKDKDGKPAPMTFIHVDPCPMYYGPGGPRHNEPHPKAWEMEITW